MELDLQKMIALFVTKFIPGDQSHVDFKTNNLNPIFIEQSTALALGQAKEEVLRMAFFASRGLNESLSYLDNNQHRHAKVAVQYEEAINNLDRKITDYLINVSASDLSAGESEEHSMLMNAVRDIERIGNHFENIIELVDYQISNKVKITDQAMDDLKGMFKLTLSTLNEAIHALDHSDKKAARSVISKEEQIDKMERSLRKKHILRLNEGLCSGSAGIVFVDIISNLERVGDHAVNIAEAVIGEY